MTIQGAITEADYVAAQFLHMRPRKYLAIIGVLFIIGSLWAAVIGRSWLMVGLFAFLAVYFVLLVPWTAKRNFRSYKAIAEPVSIEIRDDGLFFKRSKGESLLSWTEVIKWKMSGKMVLLYPARNLFHLIPCHFFSNDNDYNQFISSLKTHLGKAA